MVKRIRLPLSDETLKDLRMGDNILLTGVMYVGRDAAHKRLVEALDQGKPLPFDIKGQTIYFMGPSPAKPGLGSHNGKEYPNDDSPGQGTELRPSEQASHKAGFDHTFVCRWRGCCCSHNFHSFVEFYFSVPTQLGTWCVAISKPYYAPRTTRDLRQNKRPEP